MKTDLLAFLIFTLGDGGVPTQEMPCVNVGKDQRSFALEPGGKPFVPWAGITVTIRAGNGAVPALHDVGE